MTFLLSLQTYICDNKGSLHSRACLKLLYKNIKHILLTHVEKKSKILPQAIEKLCFSKCFDITI